MKAAFCTFFVYLSFFFISDPTLVIAQIDTSWTCGTVMVGGGSQLPPGASYNWPRCETQPLSNYSAQTAVVFVDFPDGRLNGTPPQTEAEVLQVANPDAIGNLGWRMFPPNIVPHWQPFKYQFINYWNEYYSTSGQWRDNANYHPHPDYDYLTDLNDNSKNMFFVKPRGSLREYFTEISNNNLQITPSVTHPTNPLPGIINKTDAIIQTRIDWIMAPRTKGQYTILDAQTAHAGAITLANDIITELEYRFANNPTQWPFNVDDFINNCGRLIIVYAGHYFHSEYDLAVQLPFSKFGINKYVIVTFEKTHWFVDHKSVLRGIGPAAHEYGHTLGWDHTVNQGGLCLMNGNGAGIGKTALDINCPAHVNPGFKLIEGWVTPIVVAQNGSHAIEPVEGPGPEVIIVPIWPKVPTGNYAEDQYFILETRSTVNTFDRYLGNGPCDIPSFKGGVLIHLWPGNKDNGTFPVAGPFIVSTEKYTNGTDIGLYGKPEHFYGASQYPKYKNFSINTDPPSWSSSLLEYTSQSYPSVKFVTGVDCSDISYNDFMQMATLDIDLDHYTINTNPTWTGNIFALNTIQIDPAGTLTMQTGANFGFGLDEWGNRTKLEVGGNLISTDATFTWSDKFKGTTVSANNWDGIHFLSNQSTASLLTNCKIEGASDGLTFYPMTLTQDQLRIVNDEISNCNRGVLSDHSQPTLDNCYIHHCNSGAGTGIHIISDSPYLTNNKVEYCSVAGMYGEWMSTEVRGNRFGYNDMYGAFLYSCGNVWYDNKADYNMVGVLAYMNTVNPYNRAMNQDWGNSVRFNSQYGMWALYDSHPQLLGWNTSRQNAGCDLATDGNSSIWGEGNAIINVTTCGNVTWNNPNDNDVVEPYLIGTITDFTTFTDSQLITYATQKRISAEYTQAVLALKELRGRGLGRALLRKGVRLWYQVLNDAEYNLPNNDPISVNIQDAKLDFYNHMTSNVPLNTTAGRYLRHLGSSLKAYSKEYATAYTDLNSLIGSAASDSERICYHFDSFVCALHGIKNVQQALSHFQSIMGIDSASSQAVVAKWLLGQSVTKTEWALAFGFPPPPSPNLTVMNGLSFTPLISLRQNYPNPFNPSTEISFAINENGKVKLSILDAFGREVDRLIDQEKPAGGYSVAFNVKNLPSGIYFYRLTVGASSITRKMCLLK